MAIARVDAALNGSQTQLNPAGQDMYSGGLMAPKISGEYGLRVSAYDTGGNVSTANQAVEVSKWHTPKINWQSTDPVNLVDYNRIKNNLVYLCERASMLYTPFSIAAMGDDKEDYRGIPYADEWNLFEQNLNVINQNILTQNYGLTVRFFDNGPFIDWQELNRIESAILSMRGILDRIEAGLSRLSIRLGNLKGVKI